MHLSCRRYGLRAIEYINEMFKNKKNNSSNYLVCIFSRQKYEIESKQCHNPDKTALNVGIKLIMLNVVICSNIMLGVVAPK
jgi:hypothetical protein